ncbi:MAG TPA: prolyl oligopeptidase family serine peptidase [Puia sp.]|nr:prolyl oligopeptidase family serine peptidase [Puia sp.]
MSNGYLVFTPDMHYRIGHPGQSVVNTIVSAAECLSRRPYVDARHMGIQGHSRGGWETNYILTHTHLFAAAMSSSGFCDYVALYNGARLLRSGISRQTTYEKVYQRIGTTLWDRPDLYIENSPIFQAAKVTTPVLMMANKVDNDVPFEEGVQLFTALRRLGKRAWMLQYDGQSHLVTSERAMTDLETRMKQFFDVYLKDSACPRWMLYGIPAKDKGVEDGLQLVYEKDARTGRWVKPAEGGLLTEEEKKRAESLEHRRATTVTIQ